MANYNKRNKNSIVTVIAVILTLLFIASVTLGLGAHFGGWFKETEAPEVTESEEFTSNCGLLVGESKNNGLSLTATKVTVPEGAEYESAYSITAEVTPSTATDTTINLSLAFSGTEVSWGTASSGTVTDYVKLSTDTITSGGSVTLYCYQAFGEQIILTGTANGAASETDVSATCTLDYIAKYTCVELDDRASFSTTFDDIYGEFAEAEYYGSTYNSNLCMYCGHSSNYTIFDDIENGTINIVMYYGENSYALKSNYAYMYGYEDYYDTEYFTYVQFESANISWDTILSNLGLTVGDTADYATLLALYEDNTCAFTVAVTFTGSVSGTEYKLSADMLFNPDGMA